MGSMAMCSTPRGKRDDLTTRWGVSVMLTVMDSQIFSSEARLQRQTISARARRIWCLADRQIYKPLIRQRAVLQMGSFAFLTWMAFMDSGSVVQGLSAHLDLL